MLIVLALTVIPLWDMAGIALIMSTKAKDLVVQESARLVEQQGNNAIAEIGQRSLQIEALARSLAAVGVKVPHDISLVQRVAPRVIDFDSDRDVAGGGLWPEPFRFLPGVERRSFFYGRDNQGALQYFDDYNHGRGYHHDEWYPVVRYSRDGKCFWSKSYMDPYSYQPMVTCTVAMRQEQDFIGVATIDLKLEGLHAFMQKIQERTGGYVFLLDRNNKFLTFPRPEMVKLVGKDSRGERTEEFITVREFARRQPLFGPIAQVVEDMNRDILSSARSSPRFRADVAGRVNSDSDQITPEEAEFIAAVIADPLRERTESSRLYRQFPMDSDFLLGEHSQAFIFHVPDSYWKLVVVKPFSEMQAVASKINRFILTLVGATILFGILVAGILLHRFFVRPMRATTQAVRELGDAVAARQFDRLHEKEIPSLRKDELGQLADVINSLSRELQQSYGSLLQLNSELEQKVLDRTHELSASLDEIRALKYQQDGDYFLTSLLLKPLGGIRLQSDLVEIQERTLQKKTFEFKKRQESIGGDLSLARSIVLRNRPCTVFLNADAMGKSMQGAGGILVLGSMIQANIERSLASPLIQRQSPEQWLKYAFTEMHSVFKSFDGSMLVSLVLGLIDDESGALFMINAEHPESALYRAGEARFLSNDTPLRKLGYSVAGSRLRIAVHELIAGDILILGSDGRDDVATNTANAERRMNEDETLFLRHVEQAGGDLDGIIELIKASGELTDDLSLLRVQYRRGELPKEQNPAMRAALRRAREAWQSKNFGESRRILEGALEQ
ncbi:MAG: SpoIIE family protein phosphatase [Leptospirales bacterium]|nr:SpoIIE family protein phosphatase [Leptospirales bacterium]